MLLRRECFNYKKRDKRQTTSQGEPGRVGMRTRERASSIHEILSRLIYLHDLKNILEPS